MTEQDKETLDAQSNEVLTEWYNALNLWQWPTKLTQGCSSPNDKRRSELISYIEGKLKPKVSVAVCTCGAQKVNSTQHSTWCDAY